jgi:hypothetical protein
MSYLTRHLTYSYSYSELAGGHGEEYGPTHMCSTCTLSRAQTVLCPSHEWSFTPTDLFTANGILDLTPEQLRSGAADEIGALSYEIMVDELISTQPYDPSMRDVMAKWCSFCLAPCCVRCACKQPSIMDAEAELEGCGAAACGKCWIRITEEFRNDTSAFARAKNGDRKARKKRDPFEKNTTRADVGFLDAEGILMKTVESGLLGEGNEGVFGTGIDQELVKATSKDAIGSGSDERGLAAMM